jgi:hypothetical protein
MLPFILLCGCLGLAVPSLGAQEAPREPARHDIKHGAKDVGHGFKRGAKEVGHGFKRGAKEVGHGFKHAVKKD